MLGDKGEFPRAEQAWTNLSASRFVPGGQYRTHCSVVQPVCPAFGFEVLGQDNPGQFPLVPGVNLAQLRVSRAGLRPVLPGP